MGLLGDGEQIRRLSEQVARLSLQVEQLGAVIESLARRQGMSATELDRVRAAAEPAWMTEARQMKASHGPLRAVRVVREQTGMGLREAKESVDRL